METLYALLCACTLLWIIARNPITWVKHYYSPIRDDGCIFVERGVATFQSSIGYDLRVVCSGLGFFKPPLKIDFKGVSSLAAANRIDPDWECVHTRQLAFIAQTRSMQFGGVSMTDSHWKRAHWHMEWDLNGLTVTNSSFMLINPFVLLHKVFHFTTELLLCTIVPTCGLYFSKEVAEVYDG